jgi:hypothetical protein
MDESDFGTFERAFGRVSGAFRLKLKGTDLEDLARTYFRVLEGYRLDEVLAAGKTCIASQRTFPKAAEWLAALASTGDRDVVCPPDCRQLSAAEVDERRDADERHYNGEACACLLCQSAGVADRPLRFVPTLWSDGTEERAFNPRRKVVEIVGHWAHGDELARWYRAREDFYGHARRVTVRYPHLLPPPLREREPGEEG